MNRHTGIRLKHWHLCHTDQLTKCYNDTLHCDLWLIKVGGMEAMHRSKQPTHTQPARILSVSPIETLDNELG